MIIVMLLISMTLLLPVVMLAVPRILLLSVAMLAVPRILLLGRASYTLLRRIVVLQWRETLLLLLLVVVVVIAALIRFTVNVACPTEDFLQDVQKANDEACHGVRRDSREPLNSTARQLKSSVSSLKRG